MVNVVSNQKCSVGARLPEANVEDNFETLHSNFCSIFSIRERERENALRLCKILSLSRISFRFEEAPRNRVVRSEAGKGKMYCGNGFFARLGFSIKVH